LGSLACFRNQPGSKKGSSDRLLCAGNSARSILAEAILNHLGRGRFRAFSARSHPAGEVHPLALAQLKVLDLPWDTARSRGWEAFIGDMAPRMDFVFTLCDKSRQEACAIGWPGDPITAHWGIPDPAAVQGTPEEQAHAFSLAFLQLQSRITLFLALPVASIDRISLHQKLAEIGQKVEVTPRD
jgi:arsenate reductase